MTFDEYIDKYGLKINFVCKALGISRQTFYRILENTPVSAEIAQDIYRYTNGQVRVLVSKTHDKKRRKNNPQST